MFEIVLTNTGVNFTKNENLIFSKGFTNVWAALCELSKLHPEPAEKLFEYLLGEDQMNWTVELIRHLARGYVFNDLHNCPTCKVEYTSQGRAEACEKGHKLYPEAPSQFQPANRDPINDAPKSEVFFVDGVKLCGACSLKIKDDTVMMKVMVLDPGECSRCKRAIEPPVFREIEKPSFLKPSEKHEILRLDRTRRGKSEQLRRSWHNRLRKTDAESSGSEKVDERISCEVGGYRVDGRAGETRTFSGGIIEIDSDNEEVEFNV